MGFSGCGEATRTDSTTSKATASGDTAATGHEGTVPARQMSGSCVNAVLPNMKTIESGEYAPLSRPLFMYVNKKSLQKPEIAAYLHYLLNDGQEIIDEAQYIRLDQASLLESRKRLDEAIVGVKLDGELKGTPSLDGSSTVYPIAAGAAEAFGEKHPEATPVVGKSGTGGGFKKFVVGETDINNASRPISSTEIEQCQKNQVEYVELKVAIDGLAVVVNPENTFCECLSVEQLKQVWEPESKIKKWSDLNPEWPAEEIKLYGADTDSGTFDYFTEVICGKAKSSRADYTSATEDNVLVKGVEGDKFSLGYFGFSYYAKNSKTIKAVGIIPAGKTTSAAPVLPEAVKPETAQQTETEKNVNTEKK